MCTITIQCVTSRCIYEGIPNSDNFEAMDFCICTHSEVGTMSLGGVTDTNSCLYPCLQQHHHYNFHHPFSWCLCMGVIYGVAVENHYVCVLLFLFVCTVQVHIGVVRSTSPPTVLHMSMYLFLSFLWVVDSPPNISVSGFQSGDLLALLPCL